MSGSKQSRNYFGYLMVYGRIKMSLMKTLRISSPHFLFLFYKVTHLRSSSIVIQGISTQRRGLGKVWHLGRSSFRWLRKRCWEMKRDFHHSLGWEVCLPLNSPSSGCSVSEKWVWCVEDVHSHHQERSHTAFYTSKALRLKYYTGHLHLPRSQVHDFLLQSYIGGTFPSMHISIP